MGEIQDIGRLIHAARLYAQAVVDLDAASKAHQKNSHLDEFDSKRCRTETAHFFAERTKERRKDDLRVAALLLAGGKAAEIGKEAAKTFAEIEKRDQQMMRQYEIRKQLNKKKKKP